MPSPPSTRRPVPVVTNRAKQQREARGISDRHPPNAQTFEQPLTPRQPGEDERIATRREQVLQLRSSRISYRAIARKLGVSVSTVWEDEVAELTASAERRKVLAEKVLDLELEHLDQLTSSGMLKVKLGSVPAIVACVRVSERRSKLLGADAPVKTDPTTNVDIDFSDLPADERALIRELLVRRLAKSGGGSSSA